MNWCTQSGITNKDLNLIFTRFILQSWTNNSIQSKIQIIIWLMLLLNVENSFILTVTNSKENLMWCDTSQSKINTNSVIVININSQFFVQRFWISNVRTRE